MPIIFIVEWMRSVILDKDKKIYILEVYGAAIFVICFPISNDTHFLIGAIPLIIIGLYEIYQLAFVLKNKIGKNTKWIYFLTLFIEITIILFTICFGFQNFISYKKENYSHLNHYRYIPIDADFENEVEEMINFITENDDAKIVDPIAAAYMIPMDIYHKDYDMLNKGNLGYQGENRIIQEISNSTSTKYLVLKPVHKMNWQTPVKIIAYIKNNKTLVGEIGIFDIYK